MCVVKCGLWIVDLHYASLSKAERRRRGTEHSGAGRPWRPTTIYKGNAIKIKVCEGRFFIPHKRQSVVIIAALPKRQSSCSRRDNSGKRSNSEDCSSI